MPFDVVKFERGQIWVIQFKNSEQSGHEILKDRPWLVLSVGSFNQSSQMITAVPITTRDYTVSPAQVLFTNMQGRNNVVLCEQIRSFDYASGAYYFSFLGSLSDDILEKVDVALSVHLGLHYSPVTLDNIYKSMDSILKSISFLQQRVNTPRYTSASVLELADRLKKFADAAEETAAAMEGTQDTDIPLPKGKEEETTRRVSWDRETCESFLVDCDSMTAEEVMKKWDMQKKTRYYSAKNYAKKRLERDAETLAIVKKP